MADVATPPPDHKDMVRAGTVVGDRFVVGEPIGEGAMGMVYRGEDQTSGQPVAIKVLLKEFMNSREYVGRFKREARAASRFRHPAAVKVLATGTTAEDDLPFIVMELVEGKSLKEIVEAEAPMKLGRVCNIVHQVLRALGAAHAKGIVHRDVKPDNIRIAVDEDGVERPKLLDFGVAKIISGDVGEVTGSFKTKTGILVGTPKYMSPEQLKGLAVDGRSDIYATGAMFYEMLAGVPPFVADDVYGFVSLHLKGDVRALNIAHPKLEIPDEIDGLVLDMLEKDPVNRPDNATDLAAQIEPWVGEDPRAAEKRAARSRGIITVLVGSLAAAGGAFLLAKTVWPTSATASLGLGIGASIASVKVGRPSVAGYVRRLAIVTGCLTVFAGGSYFLPDSPGLWGAAGHALLALMAYSAFLLVWSAKARWLRLFAAGIVTPVVGGLLMPINVTVIDEKGGEAVTYYMAPWESLMGADQAEENIQLRETVNVALTQNLLAAGIMCLFFGITCMFLPKPGAARI
jgi:hypothetical protein